MKIAYKFKIFRESSKIKPLKVWDENEVDSFEVEGKLIALILGSKFENLLRDILKILRFRDETEDSIFKNFSHLKPVPVNSS